jgi:adenylyltransferase/sulfurtransferase
MGGGGGGGGRREAIERELKKLRAEREDLDGRIRLLESQLEATPAGVSGAAAGIGVEDGACGGSVACQSRVSNGFKLDGGLPADMVYRYSRHLLLPDFGVEGQLFCFVSISTACHLQSLRLASINMASWLIQGLPPSLVYYT